MNQDSGPSSAAGLWHEVKPVVISASFLVGAAILVGSVLLSSSQDEPQILLVGCVGYLVAGLLAPRHPWATAALLGLVHAVTALALLLTQPAPTDPWAQMGASVFRGTFMLSIVAGMFVAGLVGHLARRLKTGAR